MASAMSMESVIHSVTPGACHDEYYPNETSTELQCFPTIVDNRFYFGLPSINQGATNTIIFNPDQGLSDIILTATLQPSTGSSGPGSWAGYAMPRGWLQSMIATLAVRIGGSPLYYFNSDQVFIDTFTDCEDSGKKQAVMNYAGAELVKIADYAPDTPTSTTVFGRTASVYIKMPWNTISALQKSNPLPTDLLTQPVQILLTWRNFTDVAYWYGAGDPVPGNLPTQFRSADINFRKTTMQNSEHLLARRTNMMENALSYPLRYFSQTKFVQPLSGVRAGAKNTINLTGFRSGSVKYIDIWANKTVNGSQPAGSQWNTTPFVSVRLLLNGLVLYDAQNTNNNIWSLCERKTTAQVDTTVLSPATDNTEAVTTPSVMTWCVIPFAQLCEEVAYRNVQNLGVPIQNSVINLEVVLPVSGDYEISAAYHYTSALLFTKNTCDYVF